MRPPSLIASWALAAAAITVGCSSDQRPVEPEQTLLTRRAEADAIQDREFAAGVERLVDRIAKESEGKKEPATVNLLAMSGGGDYGAFGAGFLVGWGQAADASYRRPDFDAVTGVSTGALLAPFAYIGTDESVKRVEEFYRNPKSDWVETRGLFFFMPGNPSFMTIPGLERDIQLAVNDTVVRAMAAQAARGKLLLIAATNLDYGTQQFWNLGDESTNAVREGADASRVHKILLASAAIPAVFPPMLIDGSAYADGGVTANVFLRLDPKSPSGFIQVWKRKYPARPLPKVRYWVIINNQIHSPPRTVQPNWREVMSPSLATAIRSATVAEVRWLMAQVNYANAGFGTDIELRVVAIPDDWRPPVPGVFKKETMESLTDLGRALGAEKSSWELWAAPEKAGSGG